jgi:hypothetical protein
MTNKTLEQRIAEIEAREEIKELRARYGWYAVRGQYAGIAGLFAPDGIFEFGTPSGRNRLVGREAISAALARLVTPSAVMPMLHNHTISIVGEEAHGTCAMESRVAPNYASGFVGYYHDKLHRFESGWLFTERRWFLYAPVFEDSGLGLDGLPIAPSR